MNPDRQAALSLVTRSLSSAGVAQIGLGIFVLGFAYLFTLPVDETSTIAGMALAYGMSAFFVLIAGVLFWVALFKSRPSRSPLVRALRERPDDVVWIYRMDTNVSVGPIDAPVLQCNVVAGLADGSTVAMTVRIPAADDLLLALHTLATRAAVGFSEERQATFGRDPRALLDAGAVEG